MAPVTEEIRERKLTLASGFGVFVRECGPEDGPLAILLHGFPELSVSWQEILPLLAAAGMHAVAPDLRGYGRTDIPADGYDLDTLAGDVVGLIEALRPGGKAHVVGHDWGGAIAYHVASQHPERVERLAVVNAPHPSAFARQLWRPRQLMRSWYMFAVQLPALPELLLSANGGARVPWIIRKALVHNERVSDERLAPYAKNFSRPYAARAALSYYRTMARNAARPSHVRRMLNVERISAPFRLIWAEQDIALTKQLSYGLEPFFTHKPDIKYLPDVGHFAMLEAPQEVGRLLVEHLGARAALN